VHGRGRRGLGLEARAWWRARRARVVLLGPPKRPVDGALPAARVVRAPRARRPALDPLDTAAPEPPAATSGEAPRFLRTTRDD
jgi:hypothetical protein